MDKIRVRCTVESADLVGWQRERVRRGGTGGILLSAVGWGSDGRMSAVGSRKMSYALVLKRRSGGKRQNGDKVEGCDRAREQERPFREAYGRCLGEGEGFDLSVYLDRSALAATLVGSD